MKYRSWMKTPGAVSLPSLPAAWSRVARQIILVLLGTGVVATATFCRAYGQAPPGAEASEPTGWIVTGTGMTEGISGLALVEHDSSRTLLLAVYDNKKEEQPRLSLLTRRAGERGVQRQPITWTGALPIDLEAICRVPDKASEFLALTSKGDLYRLALDRQRGSVAVQAHARLPRASDGSEFESFDVRVLGGKLIACWAERGDKEQPAVVSCGVLDLAKLTIENSQEAVFTSPWPRDAARHMSDLRLTETGVVLATATADPGDNGPFASALYLAGRIDTAAGQVAFRAESSPARLWLTTKHKIEALELVTGVAGGLIFGSDDEAAGGALYFSWP
jgi:hypothetical protein